MKAVLVAFLLALLLTGPAAAHVSVRPALLESGEEAELRIELPGLRPGQGPTALDVSGPGVRQLSSSRSVRLGEETRWHVRVQVNTQPGPLPLVLLARYSDGRAVTVRQTLTVLPATAEQDSGTPILALTVGLVALLAGVVSLLHFKKRSRADC